MDRQIEQVRELDSRKSDRLTVTLWWVKDTLSTYVTVTDSQNETEHTIDVPEGVLPHEVYTHPFAFIDQPESA